MIESYAGFQFFHIPYIVIFLIQMYSSFTFTLKVRLIVDLPTAILPDVCLPNVCLPNQPLTKRAFIANLT